MKKIDWDKRWGLIPTIIQDYETLEVLTLAYSSRESFEMMKSTERVVLFSTSRNEIWEKGKTSWNTQEVKEVLVDCDGDSIVVKVKKNWPACHLGSESCFEVFLYPSLTLPLQEREQKGDNNFVIPYLNPFLLITKGKRLQKRKKKIVASFLQKGQEWIVKQERVLWSRKNSR